MAKIILVSETVNSTTWQLTQSLKNQQHEVILLTGYKEIVPDSSGIDFMAYFKTWSLFEGLKIIPGLFGLNPQVLHLILPNDRMRPAQIILSLFAKTHPQCVLSTTLLHIHDGLKRSNPVRYLVEESDIVTCPTLETLGELRGLNIKSHRQGRGILPPVLDFQDMSSLDYPIEREENQMPYSWKNKNYVVIPFHESHFQPHSHFFLRLKILCQTYDVILLGSYQHWSLRERKLFTRWMSKSGFEKNWHVTGELSQADTIDLLRPAIALVLVGQNLPTIELAAYVNIAIHSQAQIIIDTQQAHLHSTLWKDGINCWIFDTKKLTSDLITWLAKKPHKLSETISEKLAKDRHIIDSPFNELNRLYAKALTQKNYAS